MLRRDNPTALARLLAVVAERWMRPQQTPPLLVNDDQPFAGVGADDLPVQLPLNVQINKSRAYTNAPKRSKLSELFGSTDAMAFELLLRTGGDDQTGYLRRWQSAALTPR